MCDVEQPEVFFESAPSESLEDKSSYKWKETWLCAVRKITSAGGKSQGSQQFKPHSDAASYNEVLTNIAKNFFSNKGHTKAYFIPYWATINQENFTADKLPIDYFYRVLIEKITIDKAEKYNSKWSPDRASDALDIWDSDNNCFKVVLYGFLENLQGNGTFDSGYNDVEGEPINLPYTTISLHKAPFIWWLGIPKSIQELVLAAT